MAWKLFYIYLLFFQKCNLKLEKRNKTIFGIYCLTLEFIRVNGVIAIYLFIFFSEFVSFSKLQIEKRNSQTIVIFSTYYVLLSTPFYVPFLFLTVESRKQDGQLSACEVTLVHHEDMGIPKDVAKLGVRQGMWGAVKKLQSGMRAYQAMRRTGTSLSRFALAAQMTTMVPNNETLAPIDTKNPDSSEVANASEDAKGHHGIDWKLVVIGGVAVVCGLQAGLVGKALLFGAARRLARK